MSYRIAGLPVLGVMPGLPLCGRRILDRLKTPPEPADCADFALAALAMSSEIIPLLWVSTRPRKSKSLRTTVPPRGSSNCETRGLTMSLNLEPARLYIASAKLIKPKLVLMCEQALPVWP